MVRKADLNNAGDRKAISDLTQAYASDPQGGGNPLPQEKIEALPEMLANHPGAHVLLAFDANRPVGIANCVMTFSSFRAVPLLNLHDFCVISDYRGKGVASQLMQGVEQTAKDLGCGGISLEVNMTNHHARDIYHHQGFKGAREDAESDCTLFCTKEISG